MTKTLPARIEYRTGDIARAAGKSTQTVAHHVRNLMARGLIHLERNGQEPWRFDRKTALIIFEYMQSRAKTGSILH